MSTPSPPSALPSSPFSPHPHSYHWSIPLPIFTSSRASTAHTCLPPFSSLIISSNHHLRFAMNSNPNQSLQSECSPHINKGFVVAHLNVRSIKNKIDGIHHLHSTHPIDVLTISETWLTPQIDSTILAIDGFEVYCAHQYKSTKPPYCPIWNMPTSPTHSSPSISEENCNGYKIGP